MDTICLQCGDKGFTNSYVYCVKCLNVVVHRYCLDVIPETFDEYVRWVCDDCEIIMSQTGEFKIQENAEGLSGVGDEKNDSILGDEEIYENSPKRSNSICTNPNLVELIEPAGDSDVVKTRRRNFMELSGEKVDTLLIELDEDKGCDSDSNPGEAECVIISCNGSSKSSKKKKIKKRQTRDDGGRYLTVISSEAIGLTLENRTEMSTKERELGDDEEKKIKKRQTRDYRGRYSTIILSEAIGLTLENRTEMSTKERELEDDAENKSTTTRNMSNFPKDSSISSAEPVAMPLWRGNFNIWNKEDDILDGLVAHMSNKACQRVYDTASQFQHVLHLEMLPKSEIWPKSFLTTEPSGDHIALYFFPSKMSERAFDSLVEEMMTKELGLKVCLHDAELLIFTSTELPLLYWRFQGKYYLWGVFRGKPGPPSQSHSSTIKLQSKTVINRDVPKDTCFEEGKIPVTTKSGDRSPFSPLSNPSSDGSSTS